MPQQLMTQWILPPIIERLMIGDEFLAELRPTFPLFLKFSGIDYDDDELAGEKLDISLTFNSWAKFVVSIGGFVGLLGKF